MLVESSRGCYGRCSYCLAPTYRKGISYRAPDAFIKDLVLLYGKGFRKFFFTDDDFAFSPDHLESICEAIIGADLKLDFDINVRPDSLVRSKQVAHLLGPAGCNCIWLGIETGSAKILKAFSKGFDLSSCRSAIQIAHEIVPVVKTNFIVGSPEDDESTIRESIAFALELREFGPHLPHISFLVPYEGSMIFRQVVDAGLAEPSLLRAANQVTHKEAIIPTKSLSVAELNQLYKEFHQLLYSKEFIASLSTSARAEATAILSSAKISILN
jgi:radical SAM superfamily enzyme YgiQ (UPF0313 family)